MYISLSEIKSLNIDIIKRLVDNKIPEGKLIDYKESLSVSTVEEKKEFLADISSFANAEGGNLIYGVREEDGIPTEICGFNVDSIDSEKLKLENLIRDCTDPRVLGTIINYIALDNGKFVLVIYIPKSLNPPHVVKIGNHWRFYSRNSAGKYPMDMGEVRSAIILAEHFAERIKNFRIERVSKIISNDVNVPLADTSKIVIHLLPLVSFEKGYKLDLSVYLDNYQNLKPLLGRISFQRYNLDGILTYSTISNFRTADSYLLLYYNGILETTNGSMLSSYDGSIKKPRIEYIEKVIINELKRFLTELSSLDISSPIVITVSFLNVKGLMMGSYDLNYEFVHPVDRDHLFFPEVLMNDYSEQIELVIKPVFDSLWQAFGFPKCHHYNNQGEWILK